MDVFNKLSYAEFCFGGETSALDNAVKNNTPQVYILNLKCTTLFTHLIISAIYLPEIKSNTCEIDQRKKAILKLKSTMDGSFSS